MGTKQVAHDMYALLATSCNARDCRKSGCGASIMYLLDPHGDGIGHVGCSSSARSLERLNTRLGTRSSLETWIMLEMPDLV